MIQPTLIFGMIFSVISAGIYFYVAHTLGQRQAVSPEARVAWKLFVVWWYALGGVTLVSGLLNLVGAIGLTSLPLFITFTQFEILVLCIALYGLMYYLIYIFTGNRKALPVLTIGYLIYYFLFIYYLNLSTPIGVSINRWNVGLQYQQQPTGPFVTLLLILLLFPQIIGSLAYFALYFRVKDVTQKYRVALVSWSIIIWFLSAFIASISGLSQYDWWQITSRMIGLCATLVILMAYRPAGWIKNRLGVSSIIEENN